MTRDEIDERGAERAKLIMRFVRRTCAASGVPERLDDPAVIEQIAVIAGVRQ